MKSLWTVFSALTCAACIAACVLCATWGECDGMLECLSGQVPMKCHWGYLAATVLAAVAVTVSLAGVFLKSAETRRVCCGVVILLGAALIATLYAIIGVCGNTAMSCYAHRPIIAVVMGAGMLFSLIAAVKADSSKENLPKAQL